MVDVAPDQWIDSCCIDKSSSAELSEAINSMFRWYVSAQICYAYLLDVEVGRRADRNLSLNLVSLDMSLVSFEASLWFKRGWTL